MPSLVAPPFPLQVDGSLNVWQSILVHLYPVRPKPELSTDSVYYMLPLLHKYNIKCILGDCLEFLDTQFPASLSPEPNSSCCIINWLKLADDLQLDDLRAVCMAKVRDMAHNKKLGAALISTCQLPSPAARPAVCPSGHGAPQYPACPAVAGSGYAAMVSLVGPALTNNLARVLNCVAAGSPPVRLPHPPAARGSKRTSRSWRTVSRG